MDFNFLYFQHGSTFPSRILPGTPLVVLFFRESFQNSCPKHLLVLAFYKSYGAFLKNGQLPYKLAGFSGRWLLLLAGDNKEEGLPDLPFEGFVKHLDQLNPRSVSLLQAARYSADIGFASSNNRSDSWLNRASFQLIQVHTRQTALFDGRNGNKMYRKTQSIPNGFLDPSE